MYNKISPYDIEFNGHSRAYNTFVNELKKEVLINSIKINKHTTKRNDYLMSTKYRIYYLNDDKFKIVKDKINRRAKGYQIDLSDYELKKKKILKEIINNDKVEKVINVYNVEKSISRTKKIIREYGYCNEWDYFVTLTFDRKKNDASDFLELSKSVRQWLSNYKKRKNKDLQYIIIPELHKDKKHYHFHGLIKNINNVKEFRKSKTGTMRYNWIDWDKKFGFTSIEKIRNKDKTVSYITKYITKDMINKFGKHRFYKSLGLKKPIILFESEETLNIKDMPLFENEYCYSGYINTKELYLLNKNNKLWEV